MKKIIFVINNFETGGVQKSLLNLLLEIHDKYEITLLTFFGNDEFEKSLPKDIKVIKLKNSFRQLGLSSTHIKNKSFLYAERIFYVTVTKFFGRSFAIRLMSLFKKKYKGYDVAISYIHEASQKSLYGGCNEFVLNMVKAKKKVGWLHCDFSLCGANNPRSKEIYSKFDTIVACSEGCRKAFLKCLPEFEEKTVSIRNCNDYEQIKNLAGDGIKFDKEYFNIVTVARLSKEKGIERALEAVNACIKQGFKMKYHIVGSGDKELFLKQRVTELSLGDAVVFYGNRQNPYPYIKNADLFLLCSYHEAAPMVFDEAACLGVPVLATETTSTYEMLQKTGNGVVCKNEQVDLTNTLLEIVSQQERLNEIKNNLANETFDNNNSINMFQQIIV